MLENTSFNTLIHLAHEIYFCVSVVQAEWRYLLAGGMGEVSAPNPDPSWISEKMWMEIKSLSALPKFNGLASGFGAHLEGFKSIFDSSEPNR